MTQDFIIPGNAGGTGTETYNHKNRIDTATIRNRSLYIKNWHEKICGCRFISPTKVAREFNVSQPTAQRWIEPMNEFWEGTIIEPDGPNEDKHEGEYYLDKLGTSKASIIRRMCEDSEEGELLALCTAEDGITIETLHKLRKKLDQTDNRPAIFYRVSIRKEVPR